MKSLLSVLALTVTALAATSRISAPPECLTVGNGSGNYSTIKSAVDSLKASSSSSSSSSPQCLFIQPGTYDEQVYVDDSKGPVTFYGYTHDTSSHLGNQVTITGNKSQEDGLSNEETGTVRIHTANFKMYNINVRNTHGSGSQAVAMSVKADSGFYGCTFSGFQDTLYVHSGYQVYSKCQIEGATDYIFGEESFAWFEDCQLRVVTTHVGYITANGAEKPGASRFVFNKCDIKASRNATVPKGACSLGRPWRPFASVVFQNTFMSTIINKAGWSVWEPNDRRTDSVTFAEYGNTGPGASEERAPFSRHLSAPLDLQSVLTSDYKLRGYFDASYFGAGFL